MPIDAYDPHAPAVACDHYTDTPMWRWAFARVGDCDELSQESYFEWSQKMRDHAREFMERRGCCGSIASIPGCPHLEGVCKHAWQGAFYDLRDRVSLEVFEDEEKYRELRDLCPRFIAERLEKVMADLIAVDKTIEEAREMVAKASGEIGTLVARAKAVNLLRQSLEPFRDDIMSLQNTTIGFVTDRPKDGYGWDVVRESAVEALLNGFSVTGNEMNILVGRFYGAKNGYIRKVRVFPGVKNFRLNLAVPVLNTEKTALVSGYATWTLNGHAERRDFAKVDDGPDKGDYRIPVKVNEGSGPDQILGKAERKAMKKVFEQISGTELPDEDDDPRNEDSDTIDGTAKPVTQEALPAPTLTDEDREFITSLQMDIDMAPAQAALTQLFKLVEKDRPDLVEIVTPRFTAKKEALKAKSLKTQSA